MKIRSLFFVLMLALTSVCLAQQVSEEQAYETALQFIAGGQSALKAPLRGEQSLKMAYTAQTQNQNDFYVFNHDGGGFVIVSADARTVNPVLGYSDKGIFDADNIPSGMNTILSQYQTEINYARNNTTTKKELPEPGNPERKVMVEPLIKTIWNEYRPFNGLCPIDENGDTTSVGDFGASMAQIMNYWRWPAQGHGSHRNEYVDSIFVDFNKSVYDWDNMPGSYTPDIPQEKLYAVQKLMFDCSVAINTGFFDNSFSNSGSVPMPLINYFNYDASTRAIYRFNYTTTEWDSVIAAELDANRPVIYDFGWTVVCDGYDIYDNDIYFHFNFGFESDYETYFLSTAIIIEQDEDSYSWHSAVIGIYPDYDDKYKDGMAICRLDSVGNAVLTDIIMPTDSFVFVIPDSGLIDNVMYPIRTISECALSFNSIWSNQIIVPNTVEVICYNAFSDNENVEKAYIPSSVKTIEEDIFRGCNNLKTIIVDEANPYFYSPEGSNVIIERSTGSIVQGCNYSVIPTEGVTSIGTGAFGFFDGLTVVSIPDNITSIGQHAFWGCNNLKTVYFGSNVNNLENYVFSWSNNVADVYFYSSNAPQTLNASLPDECTLHVKPSALESFKAHEYWGAFLIVADIPETTAAPSIHTDDDIEPQYYDLLGRPVDKDYKGLKIRRAKGYFFVP